MHSFLLGKIYNVTRRIKNNGKNKIENQEEKTSFGKKGNPEWNG
nr:MAG TPA: hypothetical protein [Caudoviricetes sp.]